MYFNFFLSDEYGDNDNKDDNVYFDPAKTEFKVCIIMTYKLK